MKRLINPVLFRKKVILIITFILIVVGLFSEVFMKQHPENIKPKMREGTITLKSGTRDRDVPEYSFIVDPQGLQFGYADYFQAYNDLPIGVQPQTSYPNLFSAGGVYIGYRTKSSAGVSQVNYSYINSSGIVEADISLGAVGYYVDLAIDDYTADPIMTWHGYIDADDTPDCFYTYDLYHLLGSHGLWKPPAIWLDMNNQQDLFPFPDDEFVWPIVKIGPSPLENMKRVYIYASNSTEGHGSVNYPSENVMFAYADFDYNDLNNQIDFDWTYQTIPELDAWNAEDPEWRRPYKAMAVHENIVIFFGFHVGYAAGPPYPEDKLFVLINENYGEGGFELIESDDWFFDMPNVENLFPTDNVKASISGTGHFNVTFKDNFSKVSFVGAMNLSFQEPDDPEWYYWPNANMYYPKEFIFDLNTQEFSFFDLYPQGANPADDLPMRPWDLDEDGIADELDPEGNPLWEMDWPIYYYEPDDAFHYNHYFMASNPDNGWLAAVWTDGNYAKLNYDGNEGYEDWNDISEIAIVVSRDNGETWSDPIFMNANTSDGNYVPQLNEMIPCFVYPAEYIEDLGDGHGKLHLFFLDDNSFGSYHSQSQGLDNGGTFQYAALDIDFDSYVSAENNNIILTSSLAQNYPNPFHLSGNNRTNSTMINFSLNEASDVRIEVYNMKGQKVKTLTNDFYTAADHHVTWDGTDDNNRNVSSGIYFYKMRTGGDVTAKKMILMR